MWAGHDARGGVAAYPGFGKAAHGGWRTMHQPGNVRELRNVVERSSPLAGSEAPIDRFALDPFASPYRPRAPDPSKKTTRRRVCGRPSNAPAAGASSTCSAVANSKEHPIRASAKPP